jgi:uncharacterized membrane protein
MNAFTKLGPKGRVEAFSDGVFAIAITLLVLEIAVPTVNGHELLRELWGERQIFLTYFVAFMAIGVVWMEHSVLVDSLHHVDAVFMRLNLLLLLLVAFLPYPARLMSDYFHAHDLSGERVGVVYFGLVLFLQSVMLLVLARYAEREELLGQDTREERAEAGRVKYQVTPSLILYAVAAGLGLLLPYVGIALYLLIALYLAIPIQTVRRMLGRGSARPSDKEAS